MLLTTSTLKNLLLLGCAVFVFAGCTTPTITNLTASRLHRKESGQYEFAVEYYSRQQTLVKDSMKAFVIVGLDQYEMQRVPYLTNRWETLVPVPEDQDLVNYRYRFDYQYRAIPVRREDSKLSRFYQLIILEN